MSTNRLRPVWARPEVRRAAGHYRETGSGQRAHRSALQCAAMT
jgi:hypothetical protein